MTRERSFLSTASEWLFGVPERIPIKNRRLYIVGKYGCLMAFVFHVGFLVGFGLLHVKIMYIYNYLSVLIFVFILLLFQREAYFVAMLIGTCELIIHQTMAVFAVGWDAGFQYLLIDICAVSFLVLPFKSFRRALLLSVFGGSVFLMLLVFCRRIEPIYAVPQPVLRLLK